MSERAGRTVVGRYVLHAPIARGGMATIHLGRLLGAEGFSRMVAAKRLHPQLTEDGDFLKMFLDEARIASKVHHPNVVPVLDVVQDGGEVILVQEYVHGVPLDKLLKAASRERLLLPSAVVAAVGADTLAGLHAAHEARDEMGACLHIVHRDVSPQNIMVGADGIARLLDFGVAKATVNAHVTQAGVFKGKIAYTSPEQLHGSVDRATDVYAAAVVLWEAFAGRRFYPGLGDAEIIAAVAAGDVPDLLDAAVEAGPGTARRRQLEAVAPVLGRALALTPEDRFATAAEMAEALACAVPTATAAEVSRWVRRLGKDYLEGREKIIVAEESTWRQRASAVPGSGSDPPPSSAGAGGRAGGPDDPAASIRASVVPIGEGRARAQWALAGALLVVGAMLAGLMVLLAHGPATSLPLTPSPAAVAPAVPPDPVPSAAPAEPIPSVTATATASAAASGMASAAVAKPADPPPRPSPAARPFVPSVKAAPAGPASDCNPPFYFDKKKKVFKPGCL